MSDTIIRRVDTSTDGRRFYEEIDQEGKRLWCYPSFTTKIDAVYPKDAFLINWIREQGLGGQAIFEKAGEEGTEAHIAIDTLIRGEKVLTEGLSLKVKRCVQAFVDWTIEFKPEFLESEVMVVNHELKVAGTRDLLCKLNYQKGKTKYEGTYVVDYKTSLTLQDKHEIQVAGYWSCTAPGYKTALLHLNSKNQSGYAFKSFDPIPAFEKFKLFNKVFETLYPAAEPKIEDYPVYFTLN